jgi:hypothetical protein
MSTTIRPRTAKQPDKLKEPQDLFHSEAKKYNVLPLDNSTLTRWNAPRPNLTAGRTEFSYSGELSGTPASAAPSILDKSYTITAEVEIPEGGAEGMIVTQGGRFGGYGLFLSKGEFGFDRGHVVFMYNLLDLKRTMWGRVVSRARQAHHRLRLQVCGRRPRQGRHRRPVRGRQGGRPQQPSPTPSRSPSPRTRPSTSASTPAPRWRWSNAATTARSALPARSTS